ncbi:MAG: VWA domain-containing protein [Candidatus Lokiarchaeota archaeon]|nr:VWA domain-containing protein [Candidatus Lokiarchaeota archaeon]
MKDILLNRIYKIVQELRENGIRISPDELVSAINSLKREPIYDINYLKTILKINLIKDQINYLLFDIIFERFFPEFFDELPEELENIKEKKEEYTNQIKEIQQEKIKKQLILEEKEEKAREKINELKKQEIIENREEVEKLQKDLQNIKEDINDIKDTKQNLEDEENQLKEELNNLKDKKEALEDTLDYLERKKEEVAQQQKLLDKEEEELERIEQEEVRETEEKLGTEEITKPSPIPTPTEKQKHGGGHRREEAPKGVTPSPKPGVGRAGAGQEGEGKGVRGRGGEADKQTGVPKRPNANIDNNKILKGLDNIYSKKTINKIMQNLFNNDLKSVKDILKKYYSSEIMADKDYIKKQFRKAIKEIKNIILNFDESTQEKKEIFNELLNRIKKITDYNYKKEILKQKLLEQYTLEEKNINDLHFKNLQFIENNNISQYKRLISQLSIYIKQLASAFKKKRSVRFKRAKKGQLDLKETMNYNLSKYGNKILELKYKKPKLKKSNIFLLCDVSGSVSHISQLFLMFMRSVAASFNKMIIYIFVDEIRQINSIKDYYKAYSEIGMQYSNMRLAYHQVNNLKIPDDFIMIILTDCRTNQFDDYPGEIPYSYESLKMIKNKIDDVIVLNPEPKEEWGSGGGGPSAYSYIEYAKVPVFEFYNLETFKKAVLYIGKKYI